MQQEIYYVQSTVRGMSAKIMDGVVEPEMQERIKCIQMVLRRGGLVYINGRRTDKREGWCHSVNESFVEIDDVYHFTCHTVCTYRRR